MNTRNASHTNGDKKKPNNDLKCQKMATSKHSNLPFYKRRLYYSKVTCTAHSKGKEWEEWSR